MKTVLVITVLIAATLAASSRLEEVRAAAKACAPEYQGENNLKNLVLKEDADKVKLGEKIFCVNKKIGIQKDNGDIDEEVFLRDLQAIKDENLKTKIKDCGKRNGATPEEAAFNYLKCWAIASQSVNN